MSTLVYIVFAGLVLVVAYCLVVMNRDSSIVVGAFVPAVVALASALAAVFFYNSPAPMSRVFQVVLVVEKASMLPVTVPHRPFPFTSLSLAPMMGQIDPKTFHPPNGQNTYDFIRPLYHEYLQKIFIDDLATKQFGTWRMKTERFVDLIRWAPMPDASSYPSKILDIKEHERILGENRFARVHSGLGKWALPPGTDFWIEQPRNDTQLGEIGTIHLKNGQCEISIRTMATSWLVGLGKYGPLVGRHRGEDQDKYWTFEYITRIDASFPWYRIGDPDATLYREWANAIIEELSFSFDEESLWARTKDSFLLMSHFTVLPQGMPLPIGPLRMSPPPEPPKDQESKTDAK